MLRAQSVAEVGQRATADTLAIALPHERVLPVDLAVQLTARFLEVIGYGHLAKNGRLPVGRLLVLHLLVRARREVGVVGSVCCPIGERLDHFLIVRVVDGWIGRGLRLQVACRQFVMLDAIHSNGLAAVANRRRTVLLILLLSFMML